MTRLGWLCLLGCLGFACGAEQGSAQDSTPDTGEPWSFVRPDVLRGVDLVAAEILGDATVPDDTAPPSDASAAGEIQEGIPCTMLSECAPHGLICDYEIGQCRTPLCEPLARRCADLVTAESCSPDGLRWVAEICRANEACDAGRCAPVTCVPGSAVCEGGLSLVCNEAGTDREQVLCPGNGRCIEGQCRPVLHNIMVLFDTSGSMNACVQGALDDTTGCCGTRCPEPWPVCETYEEPLTRVGYSKKVFFDVFSDTRLTSLARFSLLSFPQEEDSSASCVTGYYDNRSEMSGDNGSHGAPAPPGGWFATNLSQVVRVPMPASWDEDNVAALQSWVDFTEAQGGDPELRAMGNTPLGKSMFYAGEYLRHFVVVEGKRCAQDRDCGSPDYLCVEGKCSDPIDYCRVNALLVFTDGNETEHEGLRDFFNPVVQARRFKHGLGCVTHADCGGGAVCAGSVCTHPDLGLPPGTGVCSGSGALCEIGELFACDIFGGACEPGNWQMADSSGYNALRGYDGQPIEMTTYVINVAGGSEESRLLAQHGGGVHYDVDVSNSDLLFDILADVIDVKLGTICVPQ